MRRAGRGAARSQRSSQGPRQFPIHCLGVRTKNGHSSVRPGAVSQRAPLQECASPADDSMLAPVRAALRRGLERAASEAGARAGTALAPQSELQAAPFSHAHGRCHPCSARCGVRCERVPFPPPSRAHFPPLTVSAFTLVETVLEPGAVACCGLGNWLEPRAVFSIHFLHLVPRSKQVFACALYEQSLGFP